MLGNDARPWEARYFVNRLNENLLKTIYLPGIPQELRLLAEKIRTIDEKFRNPPGWVEWIDEEEWDIKWE